MSTANPGPRGGEREMRAAYRAALRARQEYRRAAGGDMEGLAHQQLHDATIDYYEALRPLLKTSNATDDLWEERELWPIAPRTTEIAVCPECGSEMRPEEVDGLCPGCEAAVPERQTVQALGDEGQPLYRWERGLQALDEHRLITREFETETSDALGSHSTTVVDKDLLPPEHLIQVCDLLDEAMRELDLLAEFEDDLPEGQIESGAEV